MEKVRVGAVSYLNTKPLLYGIERSPLMASIDLLVDYPANLARQLKEGSIDLALLPVAAIPSIPEARIISDYGIAADGDVVSVALFSQVPMEVIDEVILDYQSRTSVRLAQVLLSEFWEKDVRYIPASYDFISKIEGTTAGVIIGDRALEQLPNFKYSYDLSAAWKQYTGLDFVFAAWVSNKELPQTFIGQFNAANAEGLKHLEEVIAANPFSAYDLHTYYTRNICYLLDENKREGLRRFLDLI